MKIAVTAATGQLGGEIVKALITLIGKENVIGIARTPSKLSGISIEARKGDYSDKADFDSALKGIDALLLVSGMDAPGKRVEQHRNVINAAKKAGVKKIVYTSVQGAEENTAFSPVIQSNRQTEKDIKQAG